MTPLQIKRFLSKAIASEISDVLLPVINWRQTKTGITAILPNPIWEDVFIRYAADPLRRQLEKSKLRLRYRCPMVTGSTAKQQDFAHFLRDPGNEFAVSACRRIIDAPGIEHNPLFIYGPHGCGKSHLLQALEKEFILLLGEGSVLRLNGPQFVNRDAHKLAERTDNELRQHISSAALICFDNIDTLCNRNLAQEELFHLINDCLEKGQQLVFTGNTVAHKLDVKERLTTRLSWGLSVGIEAPLTETRLAYLRALAGDAMDDTDAQEIAAFVDTNAPDMNAIQSLANRLLRGEDILQAEDQSSFDHIVNSVALHYNIRPGDIIGKRQTRAITRARQVALMLGRRLTEHKLEALGGMVGGRDHSTVIYSIREAEKRVVTDSTFAKEISLLTQVILNIK